MSARPDVIEEYLYTVAYSDRNSEVVAAQSRVLANYAAALKDVDTYHRYFTQTRDLLWEIASADERLSAGQLKDIARRWFSDRASHRLGRPV